MTAAAGAVAGTIATSVLATLEWVDWFNHRRLFGALGYVPPAEYEASRYAEAVPVAATEYSTI